MGGAVVQVELIHLVIAFAVWVMAIVAQTVAIGLWAGKISATLRHIDQRWDTEIPPLKRARADHSTQLTSHEGRFDRIQDRLDTVNENLGEFRTLWTRIERDEKRYARLAERIATLEHHTGVLHTHQRGSDK